MNKVRYKVTAALSPFQDLIKEEHQITFSQSESKLITTKMGNKNQ